MIAVYDKLIYFNEASKYTILRMRTDDPSVPEEARSQYTFRDRMLRFTAVGYGLPQTDSVKLEIEGDWKEGKYGLQFHVEHWHELVPPTTEGLLNYLSSGLLKGIGESTARSIVQRFGTDTLDVLEFHPEKLLEIRGITEQKLEEIKTCYAESRAMRDIMELLTPFQVTPVTAMKIYQHFGPACTDILRKSPFRLCEISGFGFRRVDTIIRKSGGDPHDPVRIHGAMICALENARQHGHLYLEVNALITESLQFLNEPIPLPQMQVRRTEVEQKLQQMAEDNEIVSDGGRLYLPHIFMQEVETAAKAAAMLMESTAKIDVTLPLEQVKQKLGLHLTKRQSRGVEVAMERNLSIITGGPGTGKTTVLKAIIEVYRILHPKNRIVLAAPTGKASRRMAQSTGMLEAMTLHSLLGLQGDFCSKDKQDKPLQIDFLIVDEASMVDMWLAHQLFTRLQKGTKLLLLGDVDQLESVGAGNVFAELIGSGIVPVTVLDEIFRQTKDSLIAYNAKFINEENSSLFYGPDFQFVKAENQEEAAAQIQTLYLRELQDTSIGQLQIISPYARVSSSSEDQLNSYRVQNQYYSELISNNPDWEMVDIYADEGITGTSVEKREDFQRMMQDCRKGKIDRILVKSISRFARNTKDCLAAVRELKELGVSVLFEEQGIDTARVSSEMVTAIMASLAQKQSESISGNVQWSIQHQMEAGKYKLRTAPFGYTVRNGELTVNEAEAPIVQDIFNAYLSGANTKEICDRLNAQQGSSRKWLRREIDYILMNERYAGNAIFQKKYTRAELPRTVKRNHGERAMYYVSDSNAPIIPQNVFDRAQELRKRRTVSRSDEPKVYSGKIQCSCGSRCRAKTSNQIWYWSCVVHEEQRNACHIKQVPEETINAAFCRLYYKLKHHGNPIFTQMLSNLQKIRYSRMLWSEDVISLNKKISDILSQVQFLTQLQQAGGVDPDTFISSNNKLNEQLRRLKQEKARLLDTDSDDLADRTRDLMDALEDGPDFLDSFDAELFDALVEKIIVDSNERLRFRLKNGLELLEQIERTRR